MSGGGDNSLDSLLFGDDDDDDIGMSNNNNQIPSSSIGGTPLAPPISTTPLAPPMKSGVETTAPPHMSALVQRMFSSIKKRVPTEIFDQLVLVSTKYPNDQKGLFQHIRSLVGETVFQDVVTEVRDGVQQQHRGGSSTTSMLSMPSSISTNNNNTTNSSSSSRMMIPPPASISSTSSGTKPTAAQPASSTSGTSSNNSKAISDLLIHAMSCRKPPGQCPRRKCDEVRALFMHCKQCKIPRKHTQCKSCSNFLSLVRMHAPHCTSTPASRCTIPYCEALRNQQKGNTPSKPPPPQSAAPSTSNTTSKSSTATPPASSEKSQAQVYGAHLQMIFHARNCKLSPCPIGDKCKESKIAQSQVSNKSVTPTPLVKAYRFVMNHYTNCKRKAECPVCSIAQQPLVVPKTPAAPGSKRPTTSTTTNKPESAKKAKAKTSSATPAPPSTEAGQKMSKMSSSGSAAAIMQSNLASVSSADLRKEGDALTHTSVDLAEEKKKMLEGVYPTLDPKFRLESDTLSSKRENFATSNLFSAASLKKKIDDVAAKHGVSANADVTKCVSLALQGYLRNILDELVGASHVRCNTHISKQMRALPGGNNNNTSSRAIRIGKQPAEIMRLQPELLKQLTAEKNRDEDMRQTLLSDALEAAAAEREKSRKRKKSDRARLAAAAAAAAAASEAEEAGLDIMSLATNDLRKKLLAESQKGGRGSSNATVTSTGSVNLALPVSSYEYTLPNRITAEDALYYLDANRTVMSATQYCRVQAAILNSKK